MKLITRGAEAEVYRKDNSIIKKRIKKDYRIPEIDCSLRKFRTKREAKIIEKLVSYNIPVAKLEECDLENYTLTLQEIKGIKLRDKLNKSNCIKLCREIGRIIALLHNKNIIHGDLTTSNMIFSKLDNKIYFIDFGLSMFSDKIEDKAVDIHLFKRALESKHNLFFEKGFKSFIQGYKTVSDDFVSIIKRLEQVDLRGRNKTK
jgi:TP53 regulating kinase and related kinases